LTSMNMYRANRESMQSRIAQIDSLFADPSEQILYLYGFLPGGLKCQCCQSTHLELREGNRQADCLVCGKLNFLTANTFFHGVRRPIDWVRAIWLLEDGFAYSANMFAAVTGMTPSSVSSMLSKLLTVVLEQMPDYQTECSGAFAKTFRRRSLQTPVLKHPAAEQDIFDEIENEKMAFSLDAHLERCLDEIYDVPAPRTPEVCAGGVGLIGQNTVCLEVMPIVPEAVSKDWSREKAVFACLSHEAKAFDWLGNACNLSAGDLTITLIHLELAGLIKPQFGQLYTRKRLLWVDPSVALSDDKSKKFKPFFDFVIGVFCGISRKYLQLYLAAFWCNSNRRRWGIGSLFGACMRSRRISHRSRLNFVSPPVVAYYLPG
jgi:hypothetical protein